MKKQENFVPDEKALERLRAILSPGDTLATATYNTNRAGNARDIKAFVVAPDAEGKPAVKNICADLADVLGLSWQGDGSLRYSGGGMDMQFAFVRHVSKVLFGDEKALKAYYV